MGCLKKKIAVNSISDCLRHNFLNEIRVPQLHSSYLPSNKTHHSSILPFLSTCFQFGGFPLFSLFFGHMRFANNSEILYVVEQPTPTRKNKTPPILKDQYLGMKGMASKHGLPHGSFAWGTRMHPKVSWMSGKQTWEPKKKRMGLSSRKFPWQVEKFFMFFGGDLVLEFKFGPGNRGWTMNV